MVVWLNCRRVYVFERNEYIEMSNDFIKNKNDYEISLTDGHKYFQCKCQRKKSCKCRKTDDGDDINSWADVIEFKTKNNEKFFYEEFHLFIFMEDDEYEEALNLLGI